MSKSQTKKPDTKRRKYKKTLIEKMTNPKKHKHQKQVI